MREIGKFRGKWLDDGEWVYGYFTRWEERNACYITSQTNTGGAHPWQVDPETVGQYTGLKDKNGKEIWEGDVLKGDQYPFTNEGIVNYYAVVVWFEDSPAFGIYTAKAKNAEVRGISEGNTDYMEDWDPSQWEVVGNIHDNPGLLEVGE